MDQDQAKNDLPGLSDADQQKVAEAAADQSFSYAYTGSSLQRINYSLSGMDPNSAHDAHDYQQQGDGMESQVVLGLQGQGMVGMQVTDDVSDDSKSEEDVDGKKPRSKKQLEQKKVVVNFIKAVTRVSDEIMQGYSVAGKQKSFPLDKVRRELLRTKPYHLQQKLLDLFSSHVQIDPPVTPSVFWKYTKREVYTDKNLHRNRKMGGFKGLSGVQFRNPENQEDRNIMDRRLAKIEQHLLQPKESLYNILSFYNREAEVTPAKKDHGNRRKRKNSADQMMGMEYVQHVQHYTLRTDGLDMSQQSLGEAHEVTVDLNNSTDAGKDDQSSSEGPEPKRRKLMTGNDGGARQVTGVNDTKSVTQQLIDVTGVAYPSIVLSPTALETLRLLNDPELLSLLRQLKDLQQALSANALAPHIVAAPVVANVIPGNSTPK